MLKEIITKWLGKEKCYSPSTLDKIGRDKGWEAEANLRAYEDGYNALHQDLKSRIPELEEMIEKEIQERLKNSWNKSIDENLPWDLGDALIAINTLKGVK